MPAPSDKTAWDFLPDGWSWRLVASLCDATDAAACKPDASKAATKRLALIFMMVSWRGRKASRARAGRSR